MEYHKKSIDKEVLDFLDLMLLNKEEAIKKYGTPNFFEKFVLKKEQRGFRIRLNKLYTQNDLLSESILMEQITWEKNNESWITVWYQVTENKTVAKEFCVWKKGTDFII